MEPYNKKLVVYNSEMFKVQKDLEGYYCLATVLEKGKQPIWWEFKDGDNDGEAVNAGFCKDSLIELRDLINEALSDEVEVEVEIEV